MENKSTIIVSALIVIAAIGITIFLINQRNESNNTQVPNSINTTNTVPSTTPPMTTGTQTEFETPTLTDPTNPAFPQTGHNPN